MSTSTSILDALNWRYAVKVFDATRHVPDEDLQTILESGRLAPSSLGTEPWKLLVIENPAIRAELRKVGYDQTKITDADKLVVIAARTDVRERITDETVARTAKVHGVDASMLEPYRQMIAGAVAGRDDQQLDAWVRAQSYIALGIMMETSALLGIDACPMEGFDPAGVNAALGLTEKNLGVVSMLAIGYRGEDPSATRPKVRREFDEVVEFVK
jgi:nitroreductase